MGRAGQWVKALQQTETVSLFEPHWVLTQVVGSNLATRLPMMFESKIDSKTQ